MVIQRNEKKLAFWKGKLLSMGGRLTLLKSTLSNLPIYVKMSGVVAEISSIFRKFFWIGCDSNKNPMCTVSWNSLKLPKILGGLGIGNLLEKNLALLFKWFWRYNDLENQLWKKVVVEKYGSYLLRNTDDYRVPKERCLWKNIL